MEYPELTDRYILVREALNLKPANIVKQTGLSKSYISNVENYKVTISLSLISFLYRTFNVNMNWLFGGKGDMFNKGVIESKGERTYEDGYSDCLKDNQNEVIKLKGQLEGLLKLIGQKHIEQQQAEQQQEVQKITETPSAQVHQLPPTDKSRFFKDFKSLEDDVVTSNIKIEAEASKYNPYNKAAATPIQQRKPDNDKPDDHD